MSKIAPPFRCRIGGCDNKEILPYYLKIWNNIYVLIIKKENKMKELTLDELLEKMKKEDDEANDGDSAATPSSDDEGEDVAKSRQDRADDRSFHLSDNDDPER